MKYISSIFLGLISVFAFVAVASANPTNAHKAQWLTFFKGNKNVVSYTANGLHTIVGEQGDLHYGEDLVMKAGSSGNFHQWFLGWSDLEGFHGEHTLWLVKKGDGCPDSFILIEDANPEGDDVGWGKHFPTGEDYCTKTNDYKLGRWWEHQDWPWTIPNYPN